MSQVVGPLLEAKGLEKHFLGIKAVDNVSFKLNCKEVVGLIGDNGAGKSTLIKMLSGVYLPDEGELFWKGSRVQIESPLMARNLGIETIFQDLSLVDTMLLDENLHLGKEKTKKYLGGLIRLLDKKGMHIESEAVLKNLGIALSAKKEVGYFSGGQRQGIAIARVLIWKADLIIMDEPTAALGVMERTKVLRLIKQLKEAGATVIIISHNLPDVFEVADRIFVLRRGKLVGQELPQETTEHKLIQMMIGLGEG